MAGYKKYSPITFTNYIGCIDMDSILIKKVWSNDIVEITDKIKKGISSSELSDSNIVVFKVELTSINIFKNKVKYLSEINLRCSGKKVFFITFNGKSNLFELYEVVNSQLVKLNDNALLERIRLADLNEVVEQSSGESLIEAPNGTHFITPSGKHTNKFIRIADIVQSYNALDRISYWLLPHLKDVSYILIDNWSIASIVLHTQLRAGINIPFDSFTSHVSSNISDAKSVLKRVGKRHKGGTVLCLVSVSASGGFLETAEKLISESKLFHTFKGLALFVLPGSPTETCLGQINTDIEWFGSEEDCSYCSSNTDNDKFYIDPKYYTLRDYKEKPAFMPAKFFSTGENHDIPTQAREFISEYGQIDGALSLHKNDSYAGLSPRHHAYFIDVDKLCSSTVFLDKFETKLADYYKCNGIPDVIVFPDHNAGEHLAKIISNSYQNLFIKTNSLENISIGDREIIANSKHILFVDDVVITGTRLDKYNRSLREDFKTSTFDTVGYLIGVARPDSNKALINIKQRLTFGTWESASFAWVESLILPNWSESQCPWCKELNLITSVDAPFEESTHCEERIIELRKRSGINSNGFLYFENVARVILGQGSPLASGGASEIQVLFTIAHGLQMCRSEIDEKYALKKDIFIQSVLGTKKLFHTYNEPMIQAAFLRSAQPNEICSEFWQNNMIDLKFNPEDSASHVLFGELILYLNTIFSEGGYLKTAENSMRKLVDFDKGCQLSKLSSRFFK